MNFYITTKFQNNRKIINCISESMAYSIVLYFTLYKPYKPSYKSTATIVFDYGQHKNHCFCKL